MKYILIKDVRINLQHVVLYEELTGFNANNEKQLGISFQLLAGPRINIFFDSEENRKAAFDKLDFHAQLQ